MSESERQLDATLVVLGAQGDGDDADARHLAGIEARLSGGVRWVPTARIGSSGDGAARPLGPEEIAAIMGSGTDVVLVVEASRVDGLRGDAIAALVGAHAHELVAAASLRSVDASPSLHAEAVLRAIRATREHARAPRLGPGAALWDPEAGQAGPSEPALAPTVDGGLLSLRRSAVVLAGGIDPAYRTRRWQLLDLSWRLHLIERWVVSTGHPTAAGGYPGTSLRNEEEQADIRRFAVTHLPGRDLARLLAPGASVAGSARFDRNELGARVAGRAHYRDRRATRSRHIERMRRRPWGAPLGPLEPTTTVVIPTWQRAPWMAKCLDGVLAQVPAPDEVLVVGREEDVAARAVVEERSAAAAVPVRWLTVSEPGHIPPIRLGAQEATSELVAFIDDDAEPRPGWLAGLRRHFADPTVACVGGRVEVAHFTGKVRQHAGQFRWYGQLVGNVASIKGAAPVDVPTVCECNWMWRRAALGAVEFADLSNDGDAVLYGLGMTTQVRSPASRVLYDPQPTVLHHLAPRDVEISRDATEDRTEGYAFSLTNYHRAHSEGPQLLAFLSWATLVGERAQYGVLTFLVDAVRGRSSWADLRAAFKGRRRGLAAKR